MPSPTVAPSDKVRISRAGCAYVRGRSGECTGELRGDRHSDRSGGDCPAASSAMVSCCLRNRIVLILLRHNQLFPLILRSIAPRCVSKDGLIGASWFETAQERLLTMRD